MLPLLEGIIAAIGAIIVELSPPIFGLKFSDTSIAFLIFTASVEEIIKYAFVYNRYLKLEVKETILSGAFLIGIGFAFVDAITKQLSYEGNIILPIIGIFLVHLFTTTILGLFFWKKNQKPVSLSSLIVGLNILLHFLYNFLILHY